jgi:hypothetical protein
LSVVGFCTSQPDDDPFARLGKPTGIGSEFFKHWAYEQRRIAPSVARGVPRSIWQVRWTMNIAMLPIAFQTSSAALTLFIKLTNKALDEGDNATAELSGQLDKRERNNAPKNEI